MVIKHIHGADMLIISPKNALIDWINTIFPDNPVSYLDPL